MKAGSNWPSIGIDMARSTRGSTPTGPGPISRRGGGLSSAKRVVIRISHIVMPGLVPGIPLRLAPCVPDRDGRVKPGHDGYWLVPTGFASSDFARGTYSPAPSVPTSLPSRTTNLPRTMVDTGQPVTSMPS